MTGDRAIRWSAVAAVSVVALVAAFVSWRHALQVVRAHGESGPLAAAYPATIDGLVYCASMVLLDAARRGIRAHPLAWCGLALGIGATLAANVAAGLASGPAGALIAAWPAVALVLAYELLMVLIRGPVRASVPASQPDAGASRPDALAPEPPAELNGHAHVALEMFGAELAAGQVPGLRAIQSQMRVGQPRARAVQAYLRQVNESGGTPS